MDEIRRKPMRDFTEVTDISDTARIIGLQDDENVKFPIQSVIAKTLSRIDEEYLKESDINVENGVTGFNPIGKVEPTNEQAVSGKEVNSKIIEPFESIGFDFISEDLDYEKNTTYKDDFAIISNGNDAGVPGWSCSADYIYLPKGIYRTNTYLTAAVYLCTYDKDNNVVDKYSGKGSSGSNTDWWEFEVKDNAVKIRYSIEKVRKGFRSIFPTFKTIDFSNFLNYIKNDISRILPYIVIFGDSIQQYGIIWKLLQDLGYEVVNQGYGGCRMARHTKRGIGVYYDQMSMYNLSKYINTGDFTQLKEDALKLVQESGHDVRPQVNALSNIDFTKVNICLIAFGTNDYGSTIAANSAPIGTNTDMTGETFKGAINLTIKNIQSKYPNIRIIFTTPLYRNRYEVNGDGLNSDNYVNDGGNSMADYCNAIIELCELNHVEYIDLNMTSQINKYNSETFLKDGLHPNELGDERFVKSIIDTGKLFK